MYRYTLVASAVRSLFTSLASRPIDARLDTFLREKAVTYLREADRWKDAPPSKGNREALMIKIFALHFYLSRKQQGPPQQKSG